MTSTQIVYVDDSGTDGKSQVAAAAFCVSSAEKWLEFDQSWRKIANGAGFELKHFHMTEFAACRRNLCSQCRNGKTTAEEHPWQKWSDDKRENVLNRMAKSLVKHVEYGVGHAYTKTDYDKHVRNSPARRVANEPIGDEYFTFAVQRGGGSFAEWRATNAALTVSSLFSTVHQRGRNRKLPKCSSLLRRTERSIKMESSNGSVQSWESHMRAEYRHTGCSLLICLHGRLRPLGRASCSSKEGL